METGCRVRNSRGNYSVIKLLVESANIVLKSGHVHLPFLSGTNIALKNCSVVSALQSVTIGYLVSKACSRPLKIAFIYQNLISPEELMGNGGSVLSSKRRHDKIKNKVKSVGKCQ